MSTPWESDRQGSSRLSVLRAGLLWLAASYAGWWIAYWLTSGISTHVVLAAIGLAFLVSVERLVQAVGRRGVKEGQWAARLRKLMLAWVAAMLAVTALEAVLQVEQLLVRSGRSPLFGSLPQSLPEEWARRPAMSEGKQIGWYWHGHLHAVDGNGFRRTEPIPPGRPGTLRILAFGDSLTYGFGVAQSQAWPALVESRLETVRPVEVLNLGVSGYQSDAVLRKMRELVPRLDPDLVLYGVCLNDFLPRTRRQYSRWTLPFTLPDPFREVLYNKTLVGKIAVRRKDQLLVALGFRKSFLEDILDGLGGYSSRFAQDVQEMNALAREQGLPPIIARVLDQEPTRDSPRERVTLLAERLLREAGMQVIDTGPFREAHDGERMVVSSWEGHPSAEAHRLFAEDFLRALEAHSLLRDERPATD